MIGCLGGLGRSLAQWMVQRGARNLIFMGRSGASKPAAKNLVTDITEEGGNVNIVSGDVCVASDVQSLISTALKRFGSIGGVVHAAMGLGVRAHKSDSGIVH